MQTSIIYKAEVVVIETETLCKRGLFRALLASCQRPLLVGQMLSPTVLSGGRKTRAISSYLMTFSSKAPGNLRQMARLWQFIYRRQQAGRAS